MRDERLGGALDAAALVVRDRMDRLADAVPRFDLDEGQQVPAFGDQVDFADRVLGAPRQDAIALAAQQPGRARFR